MLITAWIEEVIILFMLTKKNKKIFGLGIKLYFNDADILIRPQGCSQYKPITEDD
ncbi:hypothetical protein J25TS5_35070 [Paenibacillus faecis]|nr:hypothetical protein J25TS5_35070 [Paenibacillus faecis]